LLQRIAGAVGHAVFGQHHRQLVVGHRHRAAAVAVDDGDRAAPVALARDAPVAQAPLHLLFTDALGCQVGGDGVHGGVIAEAVVFARIDADAVLAAVPLLPGVQAVGLVAHGDDLFDGQVVLLGEGEVALVMGRHAHHGAVAVAHQHVVADPHLDLLAGERVGDEQAGGQAFLFHGGHVGFHHRAVLALLDEGGQLRVALGRVQGKGVFGGHGTEGDAHDGVGAGGEHPQLAVVDGLAVIAGDIVLEGKAHAGALADPVGLHQLDPLGPAAEFVQVAQEFVGVVGDLEVVAGDLALLDHRTGAPATAVDDLLVGQHGLVHRVPVHHLGLALGDALLEHAQEDPLVPLVVFRGAGGQLAAPVDGKAQRLELLLHVGDVVVGPLGGRHPVLDRGVFGGQAEGVPAHGLQDVEALHLVEAGQHVADGVVAHVPHVQLARGVREHGQAVVLGPGRIGMDAEGFGAVPVLLGGALDIGGEVFVLHGRERSRMERNRAL
jgi:hypothetical protein